MDRIEQCPLCGGVELKAVFTLPDTWFRADSLLYSMVNCAGCGLRFLSPRPSDAEIGRYYPRNYYISDRDPIEQWEPYLSRKADLLPSAPGRLLDIGAQKGEFLEVCRRRGWEIQGVEISREIPNPYGVPMAYGRAWEVEFPEASFDVITMWHVFEHIARPKELLGLVSRWLKPGGVLLIAVPNAASLQHRVMHVEDIPRHLFAYSAKSIGRMLSEAGFGTISFDYSDAVHEQNMSGLVSLVLQRDLLGRPEIELLENFYSNPSKFEGLLWKLVDRPVTRALGLLAPRLGISRNFLVRAEATGERAKTPGIRARQGAGDPA